ncbi:MAG: hypothetical protein V3T44_08285 [bacterium]
MPMFLIAGEFPRRTWQTPFRGPLVVTVAMAVASGWAAALVGFFVQAFTDELFAYSKIVLVFWALTAVGVTLDMETCAADEL